MTLMERPVEDEIPATMLGDHPPFYPTDHALAAEDEFNALVAIEVRAGRVSQELGERAVANFHDFVRASQLKA